MGSLAATRPLATPDARRLETAHSGQRPVPPATPVGPGPRLALHEPPGPPLPNPSTEPPVGQALGPRRARIIPGPLTEHSARLARARCPRTAS